MVSDRSNGIYRGIVVAIVGLILIGAAPNKDGINQPDQSPAQKAETDQLKALVAAIKESNKPPKPDNGCKAGKDDRGSDLCAQWKAADAAKDAAWWTFFAAITTVVGVVIGGFTLFAAGYAAWYAKKAAIETEKGAKAALDAVNETRKANEIAKHAQRPWVSVDATPTIMTVTGIRHSWEYVVSFKNLGSTVAKSFVSFHEIIFIVPDFLDACEAQWSKWKPPTSEIRSALMPGDVHKSPGHISLTGDFIPWIMMGDSSPRTVMPVIVVTAFYKSDDSEIWHRTDRAFRIGKKGDYWVGSEIDESMKRLEPPDLIVIPYWTSLAT